eukprot:SAG11_NODE_134_length_15338_cov_3.876435_21_plen_43_part_00
MHQQITHLPVACIARLVQLDATFGVFVVAHFDCKNKAVAFIR